MNKVSILKNHIDTIAKDGAMTREQAIEIDVLTDGAVSHIAHTNAFTVAPSDTHVMDVLSVMRKELSNKDIVLDAVEAKNLLASLNRHKRSLEDTYMTRVSVNVLMRILSGDLKLSTGMPIREMCPTDVVEHAEELNRRFGKDLSISKLRASVEDFGDSWLTVERVLHKRKFDSLIADIKSLIEYLEVSTTKDVTVTIEAGSTTYTEIQFFSINLLPDFAEFVTCLIEDPSYMDS